MTSMNHSKLLYKNTILLLAIFVIGVVLSVFYINAAFEGEINSQTTTPSLTERVSYDS